MKVTDLIPDDKNFNQGTTKGRQIIEKSLSQLGAGRSILIDKDNNIIAGNKTTEGAKEVGIEDIVVVETTGDILVAVQRTDIDINSKKGRELALADNVAAKENILLSHDMLRVESMNYGFDTSDWGISTDVYEPELTPSAMAVSVSDEDVKKAQARLESRFQPSEEVKERHVTCPKCGNTFKIRI